jgi:3-oxoacyl-[acyl-carrier protein] reductase
MEVSLAGRTAIITGASKGIGLAIATRFAASGADVAIVARGREALDEAARAIGASGRGRVHAVAGDVAVPADIRRAYDEAMRAFGKIDIVVNNAGTSRTGAFEEVTDEIWREDFDEKLFSAIRLTRLAWPQMKARRWGRVINTLNIGAKAPRPRSAPTAITRAAGLALTKVLAGEGAPHNVLVNALLVGFIEARIEQGSIQRGRAGSCDWIEGADVAFIGAQQRKAPHSSGAADRRPRSLSPVILSSLASRRAAPAHR